MLRDLPQTVIVVPCFNEARRLRTDSFARFLDDHEGVTFYFVDDGSRDGTADLLERFGRDRAPRVRLLSLAKNQGKGAAVRIALLEALGQLAPEWVGYWDADLATPLSELIRFFDAISGRDTVDVVFGARIARMGVSVRRRVAR